MRGRVLIRVNRPASEHYRQDLERAVELAVDGIVIPKLEKAAEQKIESALTSALSTLELRFYDEQGRNELWGDLCETSQGWGLYYNLYSIERGCVLAGAKYLGGTLDWHTIGSEILVKLQRKDGSWAGRRYDSSASLENNAKQPIDTSLAILFLKAAAMPVITESKGKKDSGD